MNCVPSTIETPRASSESSSPGPSKGWMCNVISPESRLTKASVVAKLTLQAHGCAPSGDRLVGLRLLATTNPDPQKDTRRRVSCSRHQNSGELRHVLDESDHLVRPIPLRLG